GLPAAVVEIEGRLARRPNDARVLVFFVDRRVGLRNFIGGHLRDLFLRDGRGRPARLAGGGPVLLGLLGGVNYVFRCLVQKVVSQIELLGFAGLGLRFGHAAGFEIRFGFLGKGQGLFASRRLPGRGGLRRRATAR